MTDDQAGKQEVIEAKDNLEEGRRDGETALRKRRVTPPSNDRWLAGWKEGTLLDHGPPHFVIIEEVVVRPVVVDPLSIRRNQGRDFGVDCSEHFPFPDVDPDPRRETDIPIEL
uniref:Transposase n=1 Tax=Panagrellus redivivus TaxID=6233 RepID=A0A7E4UYQ5_PANRE